MSPEYEHPEDAVEPAEQDMEASDDLPEPEEPEGAQQDPGDLKDGKP